MSKSASYTVEPLGFKQKSDTSTQSCQYDNAGFDSSPEGIDVKLSDTNTTVTGSPFRGMGKEELLQHSSKPFWRRLRMICISIILLGWLALIITVVALVLVYPKCRTPDSRQWWQNDVIYRIYVQSFKDSDGDGIGDLDGVTSKLDYIKDLGFNVVSLSPIFEHDGTDGDFHLTNHTNIDSTLGGLTALKTLVETAHSKGMKVILDFIPNHTSDRHQWFLWSKVSTMRNDTYRNFYVWTDTPPNWKSVYGGGSAWNSSSDRHGEYYLHQFLTNQPDLNLRSSQVQSHLNDVLTYWLSLPVDGFYIRNSPYLVEDYDLRDEVKNTNNDTYEDYSHQFTMNLPEIFDMFARWRCTSDLYTDKLLMADPDLGTEVKNMMSYYGHFQRDGVHLPLNRRRPSVNCNGACIAQYVDGWINNLPPGRWSTWVIGDENMNRFASKKNESFIKAFSMLTMLLPGTPVVYYGDEINMQDVVLTSAPVETSRKQPMRGLMQWDDSANGGFSNVTNSSKLWMPFSNLNSVKNETLKKYSVLSLFKNLTKLRSEDSFKIGDYHRALVDDSIFSFVREFDGKKGYLVAINFADSQQTRDYTGSHSTIQQETTFELSTGTELDESVDVSSLTLGPLEGVVVSWDYVAKEL